MVSPVRAVQAQRSDDTPEPREGLREGRPADSSYTDKDGEISAERPGSKPASPDPDNDPQTVWYEYGCV